MMPRQRPTWRALRTQALLAFGFASFASLALWPCFAQVDWRAVRPQDGRSASEVVELQLQALQQNNPETDDGIAKTFEFASASNQASTGPVARFAQMIYLGYPILLNSKGFELLSALQLDPRTYMVRVEVEGSASRQVFVWQLSNAGDGSGWRTDAVMPDQNAQAE
mmetsp:Transcript_30178/g.69659  ORF Transcript_30178/g.69659 Transcript_30178/m.69659 type:complete len:166 (-) Transcript_30178:40-537(-)